MALFPENNAIVWRQIQKNNFTSIAKLAGFLQLTPESREQLLESPRFVLNLPLRLAQKIEKNNLDDPIFRQFVPLKLELNTHPGYLADPVCDQAFRKGKTLLHKYKGRALWLTSSACAMHCRYCFRQNFPYESALTDFAEELAYLKDNTDIQEIILSGGDPLSLSNPKLQEVLLAIEAIPHIQRIRFHTRFPIGIPERIDEEFLALLAQIKKQIVFIIHSNHPRELDEDVLGALRKIGKLGITLLNQSVLLKGVNDEENTFLELCQILVNGGILPTISICSIPSQDLNVSMYRNREALSSSAMCKNAFLGMECPAS